MGSFDQGQQILGLKEKQLSCGILFRRNCILWIVKVRRSVPYHPKDPVLPMDIPLSSLTAQIRVGQIIVKLHFAGTLPPLPSFLTSFLPSFPSARGPHLLLLRFGGAVRLACQLALSRLQLLLLCRQPGHTSLWHDKQAWDFASERSVSRFCSCWPSTVHAIWQAPSKFLATSVLLA